MLKSCLFRLVHDKRLSVPVLRCFHHEFIKPEPRKDKTAELKPKEGADDGLNGKEQANLTGAVSQKYKVFRDEDATEIFDVEEERERYQTQDDPERPAHDEYADLSLKRGVHGVFDVEDLVDVLRKENAEDIFVCTVPKDIKYVDYMVVCSGRSYRHMLAMAEFVRHIFKIKRTKGDILPRIEGEKSRKWMALDLGNIALHIFSPHAREEYDLESLWAIGPEYDKESNKPQDPLVELFEKHSLLMVPPKPKTTNSES